MHGGVKCLLVLLTGKLVVDGRCVLVGELVHGVAHEHAGLAHAAVADHHELECPRREETVHVCADWRVVLGRHGGRRRPLLGCRAVPQGELHLGHAPGDEDEGRGLATEGQGVPPDDRRFSPLWALQGTAGGLGRGAGRRRRVFTTHFFSFGVKHL